MSLVVLCFIIYSNSLEVPFQFDDRANIVENEAVHMTKLNVESVIKALSSSDVSKTRAIPMLTFAFNWFFGKEYTFGYHIVNITIHIITAFFLFLFLYKTLHLPILKERYASAAYSIAIISTFLWCVNPLQTQAVTYIVQRMSSLSAMFYIISMYCYLKSRTTKHSEKKPTFLILCIIFGIMAILSKENAIMLPFSLVLFEVLLIKGISKNSIQNIGRPVLILILSVIAVAAVMILLQGRSVFSILGAYEGRPFTLSERLLTQPRVICFYISLLLYPSPQRLTIGHEILLSRSLFVPYTTLPAIMLITGIMMISAIVSKKHPLITFCIFFYFLNLFVESSFLALELIFEHRNYLPSLFFFVPLTILFIKGIAFYQNRPFMKFSLVLFIILLILGQGYGVYARNFAWRTKESLWFDAITKAPTQSRNHINYAVECIYNDQPYKALHHLKVAKQLGFHIKAQYEGDIYKIMGDAYNKLGQLDHAIRMYLQSLAHSPVPEVYNNLSMAYLKKGNIDSAQQNLMRSLFIGETAEAHNNLGHLFLIEGEYRRAVIELRKALQINPSLSGTYINLGLAYRKLERYHKSEGCYKMSLLKNDNPNPRSGGHINAYLGLLEIYYLTGNHKKMLSSADRLARLFMSDNAFKAFISEFYHNNLYQKLMNPAILVEVLSEGYYRLAENIEKKGDECLGMLRNYR
jgi:tetratricopeptide (TPR) repeat protein